MKINILEKNENKLLDRLEVKIEVESDGPTPKRLAVREKIAAQLNFDEELVIVKALHQKTGMQKSVGLIHAYKDKAVLNEIEQKHLIKRNTPKKEEE